MWPFDQNNQQVYQQYAQAYENGNYNTIDPNQALGHFQQFVQNAPPDMQQQVYQQHFEQMPYDQRVQFAGQMPPQYAMYPNDPRSMAQGFQQLGQQQPNLLSQLFGQGGGFANPLAQGGLGGLVGLAAKAVMGNQGSNPMANPFPLDGNGPNYGANQQPYGYGADQQQYQQPYYGRDQQQYQQPSYGGDQQQYGYGEGERREHHHHHEREGEGYERREEYGGGEEYRRQEREDERRDEF